MVVLCLIFALKVFLYWRILSLGSYEVITQLVTDQSVYPFVFIWTTCRTNLLGFGFLIMIGVFVYYIFDILSRRILYDYGLLVRFIDFWYVDLLTFEKNDIHWARKSMRYQWGLSEGVIRRRSNSTMTKRKRTNNHLQNPAQKTQL